MNNKKGQAPRPDLLLAAVHVIVCGRVQGVSFRAATEFEAVRLGLRGYASNRPDGRSVEVFAEGTRPELAKLVDFLRVGPPVARVDDIKITWQSYSGQYADFRVK